MISTIHLKMCTYSKKYKSEVNTIWTLLITKPKSKSHKNITKYQFEHIKQLKNNHAKQAPQQI